jgi:predicted nucleic acid-binding Zn ribbon protein
MEMTAAMDRDGDTGGDKRAEEGGKVLRAKRLRAKNLTLLIALLAFVVLVYFVSIVRMGGG